MTSALIADYDSARLDAQLSVLARLGYDCTVATDRMSATALYWGMYIRDDLPRVVVASWLMEPLASRAFYARLGREVDHTALPLLKHVSRLDPCAICVCHTWYPGETNLELEAEGLRDVLVVDLNGCDLQDYLLRMQQGLNREAIEREFIDTAMTSCRSDSDAFAVVSARYETPSRRLSR